MFGGGLCDGREMEGSCMESRMISLRMRGDLDGM